MCSSCSTHRSVAWSAPRSETPSAAPPSGTARADQGPLRRLGHRHRARRSTPTGATARPHRAVPQGRRAHHRRHVDDPRPGRVYAARRDHLDAYDVAELLVPRPDRSAGVIPELEREGLLLPPALPRRKVAGRPTALRPRRPPRGRRRQHRQLRRGHVHGPGRHRQRGRSGRGVRRGDRVAGAHQSQLRPGGRRGLRCRRPRRPRLPARRRRTSSRRRWIWPATAPARRSRRWSRRPRGHQTGSRRSRRCVRRSRPFDTVGEEYREPWPRRAAAQPHARHRGTAGGSRHARGGRRRLPGRGARLGQLRPGRRLDRHHGRRHRRGARWRRRGAGGVVARWSPPPPRPTWWSRPGSSRRWPATSSSATRPGSPDARSVSPGWPPVPPGGLGRDPVRITWVQPEDLLPHELAASRDEGRDVAALARAMDGGRRQPTPPVSGASATPASPQLRALATQLLDVADALPAVDTADEADDLATLRAGWPATWSLADRGGVRPAARRVARPGGRLPARQAGGEDSPRGHPADPAPRPAGGHCATGSPRWDSRPTSPPAGRGTGAARRPASPRTSTGCPRTTT